VKLVIQPGGLAARVFEIKHPVPQSHRFTLLRYHWVAHPVDPFKQTMDPKAGLEKASVFQI
jgi:hypothetical protein